MIDKILAVNLITKLEGVNLNSYQDSKGIWTIGIGTTKIDGKPVAKGMTCTLEQAKKWCGEYIDCDIKCLEKWCCENEVQLNKYQCAAILSFTYNEGFSSFKKSSIARNIILNRFEEAGNAFAMWNKIRVNGKFIACVGLAKRRLKEKDYFLREEKNA